MTLYTLCGMQLIKVNGTKWTSTGDVYDSILPALKAPEWHGRNLGALWDSLSGNDLNGVVAPFTLQVQASQSWPPVVAEHVATITELFQDAKSAGMDIELCFVGV